MEVLVADPEVAEAELVRTKVAALLDAADAIGYGPVKNLDTTDPGVGIT
ncbi:hypothetical protein [Rhodococcus koreensis]